MNHRAPVIVVLLFSTAGAARPPCTPNCVCEHKKTRLPGRLSLPDALNDSSTVVALLAIIPIIVRVE